jgi:membrane associated rhomboid family serine protease
MCRNCGAIVGAGESQCAVCGAATSSQPVATATGRPPDKETIKFARAILSRPHKFTLILLVANLFVFLLMWESSGMSSKALLQVFEEPVLRAYGAKLNYLVNAPHYEWWRFIAPMFIHVNLFHLLVNMYSLFILGPFVEKLYGSAKFIVFWVVAGIAGVVASYLTVLPSLATSPIGRFLFKSFDRPSAGASGALFGLVGVLFVFGIKFRRELPEGFKRAVGTGMVPIILINLFIGFLGRGFIDNAAHLGGLVAGAALAVVVDYRRPGARASVTYAWRVLQTLALLTVVVGFYKVARNFSSPQEVVRGLPNAATQTFLNFVVTMNQLQEKVNAVIYNHDLSGVDDLREKAKQAQPPDATADALRNDLLIILSKLTEARGAPSPAQGEGAQTEQQVVAEFKEWRKQYDEWLKGASETYAQQ